MTQLVGFFLNSLFLTHLLFCRWICSKPMNADFIYVSSFTALESRIVVRMLDR